MDNLGHTKLKKKRTKGDPMHEFDRLPPLLRRWVRDAVMPWSPTSVRRVYLKALKNNGNCNSALEELNKIQGKRLSKERHHGQRDSIGENFKS